MIKLFDVNEEEYFGDDVYLIHRPYILSNPYTHIKDKQTKALFLVKSKEEAIERYNHYFDVMYSGNREFKAIIDEIYFKYRQGKDIFLGCYCKVNNSNDNSCHGEVIIQKLRARLLKEKIFEIKKEKFLVDKK